MTVWRLVPYCLATSDTLTPLCSSRFTASRWRPFNVAGFVQSGPMCLFLGLVLDKKAVDPFGVFDRDVSFDRRSQQRRVRPGPSRYPALPSCPEPDGRKQHISTGFPVEA